MSHNPHHLVHNTCPPATDAGANRGYATPSPTGASSAGAGAGASSAVAGAGASSAGAGAGASSAVAAAGASSAGAGTGASSAVAVGGASSAPSVAPAPCDHWEAETASPPSAGCQAISPASFCTHSPSAPPCSPSPP